MNIFVVNVTISKFQELPVFIRNAHAILQGNKIAYFIITYAQLAY